MQFKKGVHVNAADGKRIGTVEQVVMDPQDGQITDLIVHTGHLLGADKVMPVEHVSVAGDEDVTLDMSVEQFKDLPDLVEVHYVPLDEVETAQYGYGADLAQPVFWYPAGGPVGFTYPSTYPDRSGRPFKIDTKINMPEGTRALAEGAKVFDKQGRHVGNVEKIYTDEALNQVTGLLVSHGLINTEKKLIPVNWISNINADGVTLNVNSGLIDRLPEQQG